MREKFAQIPLSPQLEGRVDQALREVRRLHRGQVARRWGSALGSLVAVMGVLLGLAAFSPATAAKIPLIGQWLGGLFYEVNYDSKVGTTGAFVETYDALEDVNVSALTDSGAWELTFLQGYTDGKTVVLSLALDGPQEAMDRWDNILVEGYGLTSAAATVNGEQAVVEGVNSFRQKEGTWISTMEIQVPESQWEAEALELSVTLKGLSGWAQGDTGGEAIDGEFAGSFTLAVDRSRQFSFVCQAEQNGAQVFAVSGGPLETVLSVEKPFWGWGDSNVETQIPGVGYPVLVLPDETFLWYDAGKSQEVGGYDYKAGETQTADLYFDGLPEGITQVELRFYESTPNPYQDASQIPILAAFAIDLEHHTVTPVE